VSVLPHAPRPPPRTGRRLTSQVCSASALPAFAVTRILIRQPLAGQIRRKHHTLSGRQGNAASASVATCQR
jgi:hypothetical protein